MKNHTLGIDIGSTTVKIAVLDKNETYAAITEGGINADSTIIISSSRSVEDGDRVREEEETS